MHSISPRHLCTVLALAASSAVLPGVARGAPGLPTNGRISFGAFYSETNGRSEILGMSDDARFVVYVTAATNLTSEDSNTRYDCFRYDRLFGITLLMSVSTTGVAGNGESPRTASNARMITPDGRYVLFTSFASNLISNDTNNHADAFIRDTNGLGSTKRVSLGPGGAQITGAGSFALGMAASGQKVLFSTKARLSASDTNNLPDVYIYDLGNQAVTLVSSAPGGPAVGSGTAVLSESGRYVAFSTSASVLATDTNGLMDVYWKDLTANTIKLASSATAGVASEFPAISGDGVRVGFVSQSVGATPGAVHDAFVRDTSTSALIRASTKTGGAQVTDPVCDRISLNGSGRIAALTCRSTDLAASDTNAQADVLIKDLDANTTTLVSRVQNGALGNGDSGDPVIAKDGSQVGFTSAASNLELPDANAATDVFVAVKQ